ncbi:hypothetical protein CesoFtcFv8_026711 [Champsocephalus esox]|uniref:C-type lectin domain-containing protein n=1 Tax=Champsocephalus esox TaxID=159716 RepID=A0AAN8AZM1_9TELE|nr:hypothetical protein CesoFtcFv8_026711 [Champsocephalus esox]
MHSKIELVVERRDNMVWLQSVIPFIGIVFLSQRMSAQTSEQYHLINSSLTWNWLSGSGSGGDCAYVAEQGRWVGANCNKKSAFVCQGDLNVKKTVIRMTARSDVDLTDSTVSDALLEKLKVSLARQGITDVHLSWRRDSRGLAFQRHKVP